MRRRDSSRPEPTTLLLAADESLGSLAATRALRRAGYAPWLAVSRPDTYAARSRAAAGVARLPDVGDDPGRWVRSLSGAAATTRAAAVLPGTESALHALTGREHELPDGVPAGTAPADALVRATDKSLLADLAAGAGLRTPETVEVDAGRLGALRYPAVLKPVRSVLDTPGGGLRRAMAVRVDGPAQAAEALADGTPRVAQVFVAGELTAVAGVAWQGRTVCTVHQRSPRIWPPGTGITAFGVTVPPDEGLDAALRSLVEAIGWSGVFQAQFIAGAEGRFLIDFNPRIYGSIGLAIAAGANLPAIWADLVLGRDPVVRAYRAGVGYRVEEDDVRALAAELRAGRPVAALCGLVPRRRTAHGVFSFADPGPMAVTARKLARRLARRD